MREEALALIADVSGPARKLNLLREYVQAFVLRSLHESEAFVSVVFVGGTACRFLHGLPRFSEDLDFSLLDADRYRPVDWIEKIKRDLSHARLDARVAWNDRKTVHSAWIRIPGVLMEAGLAAMPEQNLSIKLEVDTSPPSGGVVDRRVITRHATFVLVHHDLPSLMAGKIHALITRPYPKGRDWYDLIWYRSQVPPVQPHVRLLQNALDQTQGVGRIRADAWIETVRTKLEALDPDELRRDVEPFLERPEDAPLVSAENLHAVLAT